jgi:hypothetical protein
MSLEEHFLEFVVDVFRRGVLVRVYLVYDDSLFCLNLMFRESRAGCQFQKKRGRLAQILLKDSGMKDYFLLGSECIQLTSEPVKITVYDRSASMLCSLEYGVLDEMGYTSVVSLLVSCSALDAQCAVSYGRSASLYCILQSAVCFSTPHPLSSF